MGVVMHVFHQPLSALDDMPLDELMEWGRDALELMKKIYGSK